MQFICSYYKYFYQTFENKILTNLLFNSSNIGKEPILFYLKCKKIAREMFKLKCSDNIWLSEKGIIRFIDELKGSETSKIRGQIIEMIKQEENFLKEVEYYKLDNSGTAKYLLKFFKDDGS